MSSARLSLIFSCVGHVYIHMFTAFFFTIVIAIEQVWDMPFHELVRLWTPASLLVGLLALPAGWLADRWSTLGMMVIYFIGMGLASILSGLAGGPTSLLVMMIGIGAFAAIYHPVGIPWVIRTARGNVGTMLAINGIFGSVGVGFAALVAGKLTDWFGWQAAFIVPGIICLLTGLAMLALIATGRIVEAPRVDSADAPTSREERVRVFAILLLAMFVTGIVFQATQTVMPKLFTLRVDALVGDGIGRVGLLVGAVYIVAGFAQFAGGRLADILPLKVVYLGAWIVQIPVLWVLATIAGLPLIVVALLLVSVNAAALPAENMLLSRAAPAKHQSLAFGVKFVLAFGGAPLAIELVAWVQRATGGFSWLYWGLAATAAAIALVVMLLPTSTMARPVARAAAAE